MTLIICMVKGRSYRLDKYMLTCGLFGADGGCTWLISGAGGCSEEQRKHIFELLVAKLGF
jgi:hypothetical protein